MIKDRSTQINYTVALINLFDIPEERSSAHQSTIIMIMLCSALVALHNDIEFF